MNKSKAEKIISKVKADYNLIAGYFNQTRKFLSPEMKAWGIYIKSGQKILDVGCGNGRLMELFKNNTIEYYGVDLSDELIAIAKKECQKYNLIKANFQVANMLDLPFADNIFDLVFCVSALHHIPSAVGRWQAVQEMQRVLKPGGLLAMNNWYFWNKYTNKKYSIKKQTRLNWLRGLDKGGILIPWKDKEGKILVRRYCYAFTKPEMKKLVETNGFIILENKIVSRQNFNTNKEKGFESLITIVRKPG